MSARPLKMVQRMKPKQNKITKKKTHVPWVDIDKPPAKAQKRPSAVVANGFVHPPNKKRKLLHTTLDDSSPSVPSTPKKKEKAHARNAALQEQRKQLPIAAGRDALIDEIRTNDVTIIVGETGSGKTTQIPQYILESGLVGTGVIAITQPRRVAATSLAERVAHEQDTPLGQSVGYSVRFDERTSPSTRIKYLTDGMIVREMLSDSMLNKYSVIIVDEAHERSLRTDLLMANLKTILAARNSSDKGKGKEKSNPLRVVVMSATLDAEKFGKFFIGSKIVYVKGRQHPVKIYHSAEPQTDYVQSAMRTFFQIHTDRPEGDVLVFLPGQEDIESLEASIKLFANRLPQDHMNVMVCPMYASQAQGKNNKVFISAPPNTRKCILATNIAETSITIPGVKYVIDTGKCKENRYLAGATGNGLDTLMTHDITKSSAMQRAGRAGREGPGFCFRLYTEAAFNKLAAAPQPEILRVNLASSMLQLKVLGFDVEKLELMDKPDTNAIRSALITLWALGALTDKMKLTPLGEQMASFPLEPSYSRALLAAQEYGCVSECIDIISVLSSSAKLFHSGGGGLDEREKVEVEREKFRSLQGDHCRILNVFRAYEDLCSQQLADSPSQSTPLTSSSTTTFSPSTKKSHKRTRQEWCHSHHLNERALLEALDIRAQLRSHCSKIKPIPVDWSQSAMKDDVEVREGKIVKALAFGLVVNTAMLQPNGTYKQLMGQTIVKIHPSSVLADKKVSAIIFDELVFTNNIYARGVSMIPKSHLSQLAKIGGK